MNTDKDAEALRRFKELQCYAEGVLGARAWSLLRSYGKLMSGPFAGLYVSGLPYEVTRGIVYALAQGQTVQVHLMHRHESGKYKTSSLRFLDGNLVMQYPDGEELA